LPALKPVMRAWLLHVDIFPGLACPNAHQRMPVIRRGYRDSVNVFVLEQLAHIDTGFWLSQTQLFQLAEALVQDAFIHVAQGGDLCAWDTRKPAEVIVAPASHSANCYAHAVICAEHLAAERKRRRTYSYGFSGSLDEVTSIDSHNDPVFFWYCVHKRA
jgi:hypothetical protein